MPLTVVPRPLRVDPCWLTRPSIFLTQLCDAQPVPSTSRKRLSHAHAKSGCARGLIQYERANSRHVIGAVLPGG